MPGEAQKENAEVFVNVRMSQSLVDRLDKCVGGEKTSRSKKVIQAVEFLVGAHECPRCHTLNAQGSVVCSVCQANLQESELLVKIKALKLYLKDYEKENPLSDNNEKYGICFTFVNGGKLRCFISQMCMKDPDKLDFEDDNEYREAKELYEEMKHDDLIDEDGFSEEVRIPVPDTELEKYKKMVKINQDNDLDGVLSLSLMRSMNEHNVK